MSFSAAASRNVRVAVGSNLAWARHITPHAFSPSLRDPATFHHPPPPFREFLPDLAVPQACRRSGCPHEPMTARPPIISDGLTFFYPDGFAAEIPREVLRWQFGSGRTVPTAIGVPSPQDADTPPAEWTAAVAVYRSSTCSWLIQTRRPQHPDRPGCGRCALRRSPSPGRAPTIPASVRCAQRSIACWVSHGLTISRSGDTVEISAKFSFAPRVITPLATTSTMQRLIFRVKAKL